MLKRPIQLNRTQYGFRDYKDFIYSVLNPELNSNESKKGKNNKNTEHRQIPKSVRIVKALNQTDLQKARKYMKIQFSIHSVETLC